MPPKSEIVRKAIRNWQFKREPRQEGLRQEETMEGTTHDKALGLRLALERVQAA
jgi:Arc/MetJ-type ribon-helix-helix transcriptional regulator